jgi:hypothetical protein
VAKREDISVELDVSVTEELNKQATSVTKISSAISSIKSGAQEAAGPIKQIATDMKSIATSSSDFVKSFGDLRKAFDELKKLNVSAATEKLKKGQEKIEEFTSKVRGAASELADLTNKISSATSGIVSASEGIKSVSTAVSSLSTSIERANAVIDAFASRARQLSEAVQSVANSVARISELEAKTQSAETRAKTETAKRRAARRRQPEPEPEPTPEPSRGGRRIVSRISAVGQYVRTEPEPPPRPRRGGARASAVQQYWHTAPMVTNVLPSDGNEKPEPPPRSRRGGSHAHTYVVRQYGYTAPMATNVAPSYKRTKQHGAHESTIGPGHYVHVPAVIYPSEKEPPRGYRYGFGFGEDPTKLYPIMSEYATEIMSHGLRRRIGFQPGGSEFVVREDAPLQMKQRLASPKYRAQLAQFLSRLESGRAPSAASGTRLYPTASASLSTPISMQAASLSTPISMQAGGVYAGPSDSGSGGGTIMGHASVITTETPRRRRGGRRPSLYRWMDVREAKRRFADLSDRPLDEILDLLKTKEEREALKKKTQAVQTGQFRILDLTNEVEDFFRAKREEELKKLPKKEREFRSPFYIPEEIDITEDPVMHAMLKVYKDLKKVPEAMHFVATRAREKLSGERVRQFREVLSQAGFSEEDIEKGRFHVPFVPLSLAADMSDRAALANIMLGGGGRKQAVISYALKHAPHALTPAGSAFTTAIFERGLGSELFSEAYLQAFAQARPETQTYIMKRLSSLPRSKEYQYAQRMRLFFADLYKRSPEPAVKLMRELGPAVESLSFSPQDIVSLWRGIRSAVPGGLEKVRTFTDFLKFVAPAQQKVWSGTFVGRTLVLSSAIRDLKEQYEKGELSKGNIEDLKSLAASVRLLSRSFRTPKERQLSQLEVGKRINDLIGKITGSKFYKVLPANVQRDIDHLISNTVAPMLGEPEHADIQQLFDVASDIRIKLFGRQAETVGQMLRRLSDHARKVLPKGEFRAFEKTLEEYRPAKGQKVSSDVVFKKIYQDVMYGRFGSEELSQKVRGVMSSEWHRVRTAHDPFEHARKHTGADIVGDELKDAYIKQRSLHAMTQDIFDILPGPSPYKYYGVRAPLFVSAEPYEEQAKIALVTRAKMKYLPAFKDKNFISGIARLYEIFGGVNPAKLIEKAESGNAIAALEAKMLLPKKGEDWLQHLGKLILSHRVGTSLDIFGRNINEAIRRQREEARAMRRRMRMMKKIEQEARRNDPFADKKLEAALEAEEPLKRVFSTMYGRAGVKLQEKQLERLVDLTLGSDFWAALRYQDALEVQKKPERFVMTMMELLGFPSASVVGMGKLPSYEQLVESLAKHGDAFVSNAIGISRDVERELQMLGLGNIIANEVSKASGTEEAAKKDRSRKKEVGAAELTPSESDASKIKRALRNKGTKLSKKTANIPLTAQELIEMAANLGKGRRSIPEGVDIESAFEQRKKNIAEFASLLGIDPKSQAGQKRLKGWEEYLEKLKESGNISQLVFPNVAEWLLASGVRGRPTPEVEEMNLRIASWLHEHGLLAGTSNTILRWRKFFEEQGGQVTNAIASQMIKPSKPSGPQASAVFTPMMAGGMYSGMPSGGMSMVGEGTYSTGPTMQFGQYSFTPYAESGSPRAMAAGGGGGKGGGGKGGGKKGGGFFGFFGGGGGDDDGGDDEEEKEPPKKQKRGRKKKSSEEEIDWTAPRSATGDKTIDFIVDRVTKMVSAIRKPELTMPGSQESFFREIVMPAIEVLNALGVSGKPVSGPLKGRAGKKLKNQLKQMGIDVEKMSDIDLGIIAGMPKDLFDYLKYLFKTTPATPRQRSRASESLEHITETAILQGKVAGGEVDLYPWQMQTIKRLASLLGPEVGQFAYGLFQMGNMFKTLTQASQLAASSPSPYLYEKRVTTGPAKQTYIKARRGKAMASAADLIAKAESQAEAFRMISEGASLLPPKDLAKAIETYMKTGDEEVFKQTVDSMLRRESAKTQYEQKILQKRNVVDELKRIELTKKAVEMIRSGKTKLRDVDDVVKYLEIKEEYGKEVGKQFYDELVKQQEALDALTKERKQRLEAQKKVDEQKRKTKEAIEKAKRAREEEILPSEAARQWQELAQFGKPLYFGRRRFTRQYFEREFGVDFARFIPTEEHIDALVRLRKLQAEAGSVAAAREAEKTFSALFATQRQREMMVDWKRRRREIEREQLEADRLQREMEINRQAMENIRLRKTPLKDLRLETQAVRIEMAARRAGYSEEEVRQRGASFRQTAIQYEREQTHFRRLKISWEELLRYMGRVFIGLQAFDMLRRAIDVATNVTFGFARQMQDLRIGVVSSVTALNRFTVGGRGAEFGMREQVQLAASETQGTIMLMKQYALKFGVPLDQLLEGYQTAAGVARQAGFTGPNVVKAISSLVAFSQAMNISMSTLARTIDNVFTGQRVAQVTLGRMLGLSERKVRELVAKGTFREELMRRLEPVAEAVQQMGDTSIRVQSARTLSAMMIYFNQFTQPVMDVVARGIGIAGAPFKSLANEMILKEALYPDRSFLSKSFDYGRDFMLPMGATIGSIVISRVITHAMRNAAMEAAKQVGGAATGGLMSRLIAYVLGAGAGAAGGGILRSAMARIAGFSLTRFIASRPLLALLSGALTSGGVLMPQILLTMLLTGGTLGLTYLLSRSRSQKLSGENLAEAVSIALNEEARKAVLENRGMDVVRSKMGIYGPTQGAPEARPSSSALYGLLPLPGPGYLHPSPTPTPTPAITATSTPTVTPTATPTVTPTSPPGGTAVDLSAEGGEPSKEVKSVSQLLDSAGKIKEKLEGDREQYEQSVLRGLAIPVEVMKVTQQHIQEGQNKLAALNALLERLRESSDANAQATANKLEGIVGSLSTALSQFSDTIYDAEELVKLETEALRSRAAAAKARGQLAIARAQYKAQRGFAVSPEEWRQAIETGRLAEIPLVEEELRRTLEALPDEFKSLSAPPSMEQMRDYIQRREEAKKAAQAGGNLSREYIDREARRLYSQYLKAYELKQDIEASRGSASLEAERVILESDIARRRQMLAYTSESKKNLAQLSGDLLSAVLGVQRPGDLPGGIKRFRELLFGLAGERLEHEMALISSQYESRLMEAELMPGMADAIKQSAESFLLSAETQARLSAIGTLGGIATRQADEASRRIAVRLEKSQSEARLGASALTLVNPLSETTDVAARIYGSMLSRSAIQEAVASLDQQISEYDATAQEVRKRIQSIASTDAERIAARAELQRIEEKRNELERQRINLLAEGNERLIEEIQLRMELYRRSFAGSILSGLISGGPFGMLQPLAQRGEEALNKAFARLLGYIPGPRRGVQEQRVEAEKVQINVSGGDRRYSIGGQLMEDFKNLLSQNVEESKAAEATGKQVTQDAKSLGKMIAEKLGISDAVTASVGASYQAFRIISGTIETVDEIQDRIRALRNQVGWTLNPDKYAQRAMAEVLRPFGLGGFGKIIGMSNLGKGLSAAGLTGVGAGVGFLVGGPVGAAIGAGLGALLGAFGASGFGLFRPPTPASRLRRGLQRVFDELGIPRDARGGRGISFMPTEYSEITGEVGAATGLYLRKRYPGLGDLGLLPIRMIYATAQAGKALGLAREDTEYLARSVSKKLVPSLEAAAMALASLYRKGAIGQKDFLNGAAGIARIFGELPPAINAAALAVNAFARDGSISFERLKRTIQDAQQVVSRGIADAVRLGVESGGSVALTGQAIGDAFSDAFLQRVTERLMQRKDIGDALTRAVAEAESAAELLAEGRTQEYAVQIQKVMSLIAESQTKVAQIISPVTQALYSVRTTLGIGAPGVYAQIGFGAYNSQYIANQPARYLYKDTGESATAYAPRAFRHEDIEKMGQVIAGAVATAIERSSSGQRVTINVDGGEFGTAVSGVMYKQSKTRGIQVSTPQMFGLE